jgi:hypothetical protein
MMFKWTCPFCNGSAVIRDKDYETKELFFTVAQKKAIRIMIIECPNPDCNRYTLAISLYEVLSSRSRQMGAEAMAIGKLLKTWRLIPTSEAKPFPDYISKQILQDYEEACMVKDLSPKASATLSRRCMQGMIRDFWKVKGARLKDEIDKIEDKCDPDTWKAIDAVRSVGNIGAHMEKDINLIIDVDPNEAQLLISLIETLLKDWYVNRHEREARLKSIIEVAEKKEEQKKGGKSL